MAMTPLDRALYQTARALEALSGVSREPDSNTTQTGSASRIEHVADNALPFLTTAALAAATGGELVGYSSSTAYSDGTVGNELIPRVTRALLRAAAPKEGKLAFLQDSGREGMFICREGASPADPREGIYIDSNTANFYWERVWDKVHGKPEWFLETADTEWRDAFGACIALCPVMQLEAKDYFVAGTWAVNTGYRTIEGKAKSDGYGSSGTRVLCSDAAANVMRVGPASWPGSVGVFTRNITVRNIALGHSAAMTGPADPKDAVKGFVANYLLDCKFEGVYVWEEQIGFWLYQTVACIFDRCKAFRSAARLGTDFARGFWVRGIAPGGESISFNGGNASLTLRDCAFETNSSLAIAKRGVFIDGDAADLFVYNFEASQATNGIYMTLGTTMTYGAQNIHFIGCVIDQCAGSALHIEGLNAQGSVSVNGGYYQANVGATSVVNIVAAGENGSAVSFGGGCQIVCGAAGDMRGIASVNQDNVTVDDTVLITDCGYGVTLTNGNGHRVTCTIKNPNINTGTQAGVFASAVNECLFAPRVTGAASGFGQGIFLTGTANTKVHVDPTRVSLSACSGGTKLAINATNITAAGSYASGGGAGSDIVVTGIAA